MADEKITIKMEVDAKDLDKAVASSQTKATKLSKTLGGIGSGIKSAFQVGAVAAAGLGAAIIGVVNTARRFEEITTQFKVLTGSASEARKTVEGLQQFAASTPFQFEGISSAAQQLLGFGFSADELVPKLKQIGDVASAIGKPIEEVGFIYGQVAAAGKLTGERLLQFQERAIPIGPAIAKTMGIAESSVKDMVSSGEVDFATFEKAFSSLSANGGFAFEGMVQQSKTLSGLISTVKDNFTLFAANLGKRLLPVFKLVSTQVLSLLQNLNTTGEGLEEFTGTMNTLFNFALRVKQAFQSLGAVIGGGLATALEAASAAINLNFTQAKQIITDGTKQLGADLVKINQETEEQMKSVDASFAEAREQERIAEAERIKESEIKKAEIKSEAQLLAEEKAAEDMAREKETKTAHEAALEKIEKTKLKNIEDAKRANALTDLKASVKENNLRLKEEARFGKDVAAARAFFRSEDVKATGVFLNSLIALNKSGNKDLGNIAKTASIARAVINTAEGVSKAWSLGPILGPASAVAVGIAGAAEIATIKAQGFAAGGLAMGGIPGKDSIPSLLQSGEIVAPKMNFDEVIGSVRAKREADKVGTGGGQSAMVELSFKDNIGEFIDAQVIERRALGISSI